MTKSAAALFGAAVLVACTPVTTFKMLVPSDRDLFAACTPSLMTAVCGKSGDEATKASCLASRSAAYGKLRSPKIRRSWLIANGCPQTTVDAPPKPAAEIVAATEPPPPPEPAPATEEAPATPEAAPEPPPPPEPAPVTAELSPPAKPIASPLAPTPKPQPSTPPPRSPPLVAAAPRTPPSWIKAARPRTRSLDVFDLRLEAAAISVPSSPKPPPPAMPPPAQKAKPPAPSAPSPPLEVAAAPPPPPEPAPVPPIPAAPEPVAPRARPTGPAARAFSDKERREQREQRLREILVAHRSEMKACVDRQLKLLPDLRAEGTLVIEVDASGAVPRSELVGADLAGTPLEDCLRTIASRWRFPSAGRAYRIDAPVRVWGSVSDR